MKQSNFWLDHPLQTVLVSWSLFFVTALSVDHPHNYKNSVEFPEVFYISYLLHYSRIRYYILLLFSSLVMSNSLWPHGLQHARFPCPSPTPGDFSNSCPLSQWCHPAISSSVIPFSCLQSFPASGSFIMSQFFASGGQSIRTLASASVPSVNIQDWFPSGLTGWISLQSKGLLSRVFSNTTVQKHHFFSAQPPLWSKCHIHIWLWKNHSFDYTDLCWQSNVSAI